MPRAAMSRASLQLLLERGQKVQRFQRRQLIQIRVAQCFKDRRINRCKAGLLWFSYGSAGRKFAAKFLLAAFVTHLSPGKRSPLMRMEVTGPF